MNTTHTGSFTPKYRELYQWLADRIYDGTYKYQQKLPSESALCRQFSISRQTVRNAMDQLECDGFIIRSKGSGKSQERRRTDTGHLCGRASETVSGFFGTGRNSKPVCGGYLAFSCTVIGWKEKISIFPLQMKKKGVWLEKIDCNVLQGRV